MQMLDSRTHWPREFLIALELLSLASARLPFGVPDPVLCGDAAVALYTGGLRRASALAVATADAGKLVAELFGVGFRVFRDPRQTYLWHSDCGVGIEILPAFEPKTLAEQANQILVDLDLEWREPCATTTLRVVGIEDLIVEQARCWLLDGAPSGEQIAVLQALVGLARAGVGGPLRLNYLQRRLALETNGEVIIEDLQGEAFNPKGATLRSVGLTEMQVRLQAWRAREGLPSHPSEAISSRRSHVPSWTRCATSARAWNSAGDRGPYQQRYSHSIY